MSSDRTVDFGNEHVILDTVGDGNGTIQRWFSDPNSVYVRDGEMTRQKDKLAFVGTSNTPGDQRDDDQVRIYRMNGAAPALPTHCFSYARANGKFESPSFSPDGQSVAFGEHAADHDYLLVGDLPDMSAGCQVPAEGAFLVLDDARGPDWGPAEVPVAAAPGPGPGPQPGPGPVPGPGPSPQPSHPITVTAKRVALRRALAVGVTVAVSTGEAGTVTARLKLGGSVVGSGSAKVGAAGTGKVTIRFTKQARRRLARRRSLKLTVALSFRPASGGRARAATASLKLKR